MPLVTGTSAPPSGRSRHFLRGCALLGALLLATASCRPSGLRASLSENSKDAGASASRQTRLALQSYTWHPAVAAAVGITGRGLVGRRLPDGKLWRSGLRPNVLPSIQGDLVLFSHGERVTALDSSSGLTRFSIDVAGRRLEALAYDGKRLALSLVDEHDARRDQLRIVDLRGETLHQATSLQPLGQPAFVTDMILVPWADRAISVFDLGQHKDLGRFFVPGGVHRVESRPDGLWVYGESALPLKRALLEDFSATLELSAPPLPGDPSWPRVGSAPRLARSRSVALLAYPVKTGGTLGFAEDSYAFSYFDVLVGFEHGSNRVRWTTHFDRSVVGSTVNRTGPVVCLEDGTIRRLRMSDGADQPSGSLNSRLRSCVVQMPDAPVEVDARPPLRKQIHQTITATGPEMAPVHELLLRDLGRRPGPEVTQELLDISLDPLTSAALAQRAAHLLEGRKSGADLMIEALERTEERLGRIDEGGLQPGVRPAPVESLSRALAAMGRKDAAPALAAHLTRPSISGQEALSILQALEQLGGPESVPVVREFLLTHRSVGGSRTMIEAQALATEFVLKHASAKERKSLKETLGDNLTHPSLSEILERRKIVLTDGP